MLAGWTPDWARLLAFARSALALVCLILQLRAAGSINWIGAIASALFLYWGAGTLVFRWKPQGGLGLLALVGETIFFLVIAGFGAGSGTWLAPAIYCYLMVSAVLTRPWHDTWVVAAACAAFVVANPGSRSGSLAGVVFWVGFLAAIVALFKSDLEERLAAAGRQLREQAESSRRASDAQRHKLAGDFHDGPLQSFIGMQLRLEILGRLLKKSPQAVEQEVRELQEIARSQVGEIRAFLRGIRPLEVGGTGLAGSLRQAVAEFQKHSGITATFQSEDSPELPSAETTAELLQVVREALTNVLKHSRATWVTLTLKRAGQGVEVTAEDNGVGFPFSGAFNLDEQELLRIGPFSIQKRVRSLNGELTVESRPERGARIRVRIPA